MEDYEPRFDPTVIPLPNPSAPKQEESPNTDINLPNAIPQKKYYSVADYHALYMSGELTPLAVVKSLLPLVRRDTKPAGEYSTAWFDVKVDLILKAAEESTQRFKIKTPLGPLDGVPAAAKDEYDMVGYKTSLGSLMDYTSASKAYPDEPMTSWCVRKLEEAGAIVMGKLSMHEYGLGKSVL